MHNFKNTSPNYIQFWTFKQMIKNNTVLSFDGIKIHTLKNLGL